MRSRELAACVACDPTIPVRTQRCFDVHTTSITLKRRCMGAKATSCAYWDHSRSQVFFVFFDE